MERAQTLTTLLYFYAFQTEVYCFEISKSLGYTFLFYLIRYFRLDCPLTNYRTKDDFERLARLPVPLTGARIIGVQQHVSLPKPF